MEENLQSLMQDNEQLVRENAELSARLQKCEEPIQQATSWSLEKEQELLGKLAPKNCFRI